MGHDEATGHPPAPGVVSERHRRQIPIGPGGWRPFPADLVDGTVHGAFEHQARATPGDVALAGPGGELTYAELDRRADLGAGLLLAAGAAGRPVALAMGHDVDLVVAVFAVLKAGAVVLILDPAAAIDVNRAILADAEPAVVVVDDRGAEIAGAAGSAPVLTDLDGVAAPESAPLPVAVGPGDPAMLAYSSGTTGGAKAAVIPHRALVHLFRGAIDVLRIGPGDRLPMIFPISLAVAAYPMFLPLMVGGSLRVHDVRSHGLVGFPEWLADQRISVLYVSPTVARFMGEVPEGVDLSALRVVVLGGERVDGEVVEIVHGAFGDEVTIANGYGATETGVLTFFVVDPDDRFGPLGVPVGAPIPETELRIVDDAGNRCEPGVAGDVFVRSPYLFSGYWKRSDLDDAVLGDEDGVAVYRTGDVGLLDADGNLVLVGRSDSEVKVRGHRINPGEVEQALLALQEVADAIVEGRPDLRGTNELVAWIVPADGQDVATIRAAAKQVMRAPMVPARMVLLDALPQLPNGKLDRRALPDPAADRAAAGGGGAPTTPVEVRLVSIWEEILDVRPLGIDRDLIALGAASFDLAWSLVLIEERLGVQVPMARMLEVRTVAELAVVVEELQDQARPPERLVEVQAGAPGQPKLFVVHDLHGTAYSLRHLAPALGADQPVWGFESPFLEGRGGVADTLEDLARQYVEALRTVDPDGPYHLAGYSFGGVLAFEIATQLVAAGAEVAFLGIVDVGPGYRGRHYNARKMLDKPWSRIPYPPDRTLPVRKRAAWYRDLVQRSPREAAYHLSLRTGLDRWLDPLQFRLDLRHGGTVPPDRRLWYAWRQHWELARRYRWDGPRYPGGILLVWADESAATDGTMGWSSVVDGEVVIVHVDIPHERMLQPDEAVTIGRILRSGLDQAVSRPATEPGS